MICVITLAIISTIILAVLLFCFILFHIIGNEFWATILSAVSSVFASLAFGLWTSYIVNKGDKKKSEKREKIIIKNIRDLEFAKLKAVLSYFLKMFSVFEYEISNKLNFIKCSFKNRKINFESLTANLFVLDLVYKDIDKYVETNDIEFVKHNIDRLLMRDDEGEVFEKGKKVIVPQIYELYTTLNEKCVVLYAKMQKINNNSKLQVFGKEEIETVRKIAHKKSLKGFTNFYPPYEIVELIKKLSAVNEFLCVDCEAYYIDNDLFSDLKKLERDKNDRITEINAWCNEQKKIAQDILDNIKKD